MRSAPHGERPIIRALRRIGRFQSSLLLTLVYGLVWLPVGLVARLAADWLHRRPPRDSCWSARAERLNRPEHLRDPF